MVAFIRVATGRRFAAANALLIVAIVGAGVGWLAADAAAQRNASVDLFDSPIKVERETHGAGGELIACSIALPGSAALYGVDTVTGSSAPVRMILGELFGSFRVWQFDEGCRLTSTWSTALVGSTQTGLAVPNGDPTTYWAIDPASSSAALYELGVGTATGVTIPLPVAGYAAVVDDNQPGELLCVADIVNDTFICVDAAAGGAFVCSYANADNTGAGAFGNGIGDAVNPAACAGEETLVQASGTIGEGQVMRVGQYDCSGVDPNCRDRWSVAAFSIFTNGIEEFDPGFGGIVFLAMVDNAGSNLFLLQGIPECARSRYTLDCQDIDADMDLLYVNASQGGATFTVSVDATGPLSVGMQRTSGGNGKFVAHVWSGSPNFSTCRTLFDLGTSCFDFLDFSAAVVANGIGKTNRIGASNYFGVPAADPQRAPTFIESLLQAEIDSVNLPAGSQWTLQGIHLNATSSSTKGASLTNTILAQIE